MRSPRGCQSPSQTSPFVPAFSLPFRVPPTLRPVRSTATTDFFDIVQRTGLVQILPGRPTPVWGYNGIFPDPTLPLRDIDPAGAALTRHFRFKRENGAW